MRKSSILAIISGAVLAVCCSREYVEPDTPRAPLSGDGDRVEVTVDFRSPSGEFAETKSSILEGAENVFSGATVYACTSGGGRTVIEEAVTVEGLSPRDFNGGGAVRSVTLNLRWGQVYDIYVVGNAWYIHKGTGKRASWFDAMGSDASMDFDSGLKTAVHRFDGSDFRNGYRHETLAEVKAYGLPYSGSVKGIRVRGEGSFTVDNCRFLFARVNLTVDHTGLDGNINEGYFKNSSVSIRQANGALSVFAATNRMTAASDAITADGDPSMTNAHRETYTFYVPENMQGDLLTTDSPALRNLDNPSLSSSRGLLTYLEFKGTVNPSNAYASQIGYTGDFTYRFCLGRDNCRNFDVIGGHCYDIALKFTVSSLFDPEAEWKVSSDSFTDGRVIDVMKFSDCAEALGASQPVIVRANRPGKVFLYVNKEGIATGGANVAKGKALVASADSYIPANVTDCAVSVSPTLSSLSEYGLTAVYEASDASLTFSVTDMSKFASWLSSGQDVKLTATLLPSMDNARKREFTLKPYRDLSVSGGFDGFYVAMKRTLVCDGFYGSSLRLYNGSGKAGSPSLKYVNGGAEARIGNSSHPCVVGGNGSYDVVACRETDSSNECLLCVASDDAFNDGVQSLGVTVRRPWPVVGVRDYNRLYIKGNDVQIPYEYYTTEAHTVRIPVDDFEKKEFQKTLLPRFSFTGTHQVEAYNEMFRGALGQTFGRYSTPREKGGAWQDAVFLHVDRIPEGYRTRESYPIRADYDIPYFTDELSVTGVYGASGSRDLVIPAFDVGLTDGELGAERRTLRFTDNTLTGETDSRTFQQEIIGATFGVGNPGDLDIEVIPRMKESGENGSITATGVSFWRTDVEHYFAIRYTVRKGPSTQSHSIGYHDVRVSVTNSHSKQRVYSDHTFIAKVSQTNVVGGTLELVHYGPSGTGERIYTSRGEETFGLDYPFAQWKIGADFACRGQMPQGVTAEGLYVASSPQWENGASNLFVRDGRNPDSPYYSWTEAQRVAVGNPGMERPVLRYETFIGDTAGFHHDWERLTEKEFIMDFVRPRISLYRDGEDSGLEPVSGVQNVIFGSLKDTVTTSTGEERCTGYLNVVCSDEWLDVLSRTPRTSAARAD